MGQDHGHSGETAGADIAPTEAQINYAEDLLEKLRQASHPNYTKMERAYRNTHTRMEMSMLITMLKDEWEEWEQD